MGDAPEKLWMTAEEMGWPGSFRSFRMSDLEHPEDEYPAYVRADLYEQVKRERDELALAFNSSCEIRERLASRAEAAERLAGARVKIKPLEWEKGVVDWAKPLPGMKYVACSTTPSGSWAFWLEDAPETRAVFGSEAEAKAAAQADYERRIRSALAEPAGEAGPVAWRYKSPAKGSKWTVQKNYPESVSKWAGYVIQPLYTTPPDASAIRGALDIPECVLSLCNDKITMAFETSEDATCAFDAIDAALAGAKP